ncbi:hypothetical protein ASPZODRAFT_2113219 [Penicilliopsis zonata CBS 506.65]|uniref:NodB homology domain-containing protein n=1 Tax=Penicilliopsis zonata CBS 506.65 TaxID=1073090 RepID=A0A1L9SAA9_9EURO|nr:hypothetical protein ASPZODRAFT_2113219 [Penicilliopsis zonata CBS 506.65]OJJ44113.1 hypothetical protein ASPZODRAFT_2113219 [Penicilliopsis zonata CBS 506.65]
MAHWISTLLIFLLAPVWSIAAPMHLVWSNSSSELVNQRRVSRLPFGAVIDRCTVPGTVALTFDDGPFIYTPAILDILRANGARVTFFLNGHGLGKIYENADVVRRAINEGHQLGSHTWGHPYLTTLDYPTIVAQMTQLETAFRDILGFFPTYMRAPYLMVNGLVLSIMAEMGYHVIGASIDTKDYENDNPGLIWRSFEKFKSELNAGGNIVLAHDVHEQTVRTLVQNMLSEIYGRGMRVVPVGECLDDPPAEWYRGSR